MEGKSTPAPATGAAEGTRARRRYDSPVRRRQAAQTRERIVAAGAELAHGLPGWDWRELTFKAVARAAGVSESTVYRHFAHERDLHDAVMQTLQARAGVTYEGIGLDEVGDVAARVFATLSSFAAPVIVDDPHDPTFIDIDVVRREALRSAVADAAPHLPDPERDAAAGLLDVLWSPVAYQRLVVQWRLSDEAATAAIRRVIDLVVASVRDRPGSP